MRSLIECGSGEEIYDPVLRAQVGCLAGRDPFLVLHA